MLMSPMSLNVRVMTLPWVLVAQSNRTVEVFPLMYTVLHVLFPTLTWGMWYLETVRVVKVREEGETAGLGKRR